MHDRQLFLVFALVFALFFLVASLTLDCRTPAADTHPRHNTDTHAAENDEKHTPAKNKDASHATTRPKRTATPPDNLDETADIILTAPGNEEFKTLLKRLQVRGMTPKRTIPKLNALVLTATKRQRDSLKRDFPDIAWELDAVIARPQTPNPNAVAHGVPFGNTLLDWLGIDRKQKGRGYGVTIAVLDEPLTQTLSTANADITQLDLYGLAQNQEAAPGHGNAVASILAADGELIAGIVPDAKLLSIPVLNVDGVGSAATLADAIISATDRGADIISISLGSEVPSTILQAAVDYASDYGAVILAAAGNEGGNTPFYPAACDKVIAVAACDAASNAPAFSNYGDTIDIAAPGVEIAADFGGETPELFSGTSASTPCVAGVIADIMSLNPDMTAAQAAQLVLDHADDFGAPGKDLQFGHGVLSYMAAANWNNPDYTDAAVAGHFLDTANATEDVTPLVISARNAGNTNLKNLTLLYSINDDCASKTFLNVTIGQTVSIVINIPNDQLPSLSVLSAVTAQENESRKDNNAKSTRFILKTPEN